MMLSKIEVVVQILNLLAQTNMRASLDAIDFMPLSSANYSGELSSLIGTHLVETKMKVLKLQ